MHGNLVYSLTSEGALYVFFLLIHDVIHLEAAVSPHLSVRRSEFSLLLSDLQHR